jgi:hypothetical protein
MDFLAVGLVRIVVPLLILRRPLPGILLAVYIDYLDWRLLGLETRPDSDRDFYQRWDKALDTYYLSLALFVSLGWQDRAARNLGLILFSFRLPGVFLLTVTGNKEFLFVFPNLFENYFIFNYIYRHVTGEELRLGGRSEVYLLVVMLLVPQLAREYSLHVLEDRPWNLVPLSPERGGKLVQQAPWILLYLAPPAFAMANLLKANGTRPRLRLSFASET